LKQNTDIEYLYNKSPSKQNNDDDLKELKVRAMI